MTNTIIEDCPEATDCCLCRYYQSDVGCVLNDGETLLTEEVLETDFSYNGEFPE